MRVIEVCCGAGGLSLGLRNAGFRIERAFDFSEEALAVYRRNLPLSEKAKWLRVQHHARFGDLSQLLSITPEVVDRNPDVIAGGPPCQDFSSAGLRLEGTRADLTMAFAILIATARPKWLLMENVPEARRSEAWGRAKTILTRAGYGLTEKILDASFYGAPQARERFVAVGRLGEADGFLDSAIDDARLPRPMTVRDLLGDDVGVHPGGDHPPETRVFFIRPFTGGRGVRSIDDPCPTIIRTSGERATRGYQSHKDDLAPARRVPPLTMEQISRVQGFPEWWNWDSVDDDRTRNQMIANAMPAPLAEAVGRVIMARERGETIPAIEPDFTDWLRREKSLSGQVLRNRRAHLNRARRLLGGRMLADLDIELAMLEKTNKFVTLSPSGRSDLRMALRLHAEWRRLNAAFERWLRHEKGMLANKIRKCRKDLSSARRILCERADIELDPATLKDFEGFRSLNDSAKSAIRRALRLYVEWQRTPPPTPGADPYGHADYDEEDSAPNQTWFSLSNGIKSRSAGRHRR